MDGWQFFVLGVITYQILKMLAQIINRAIIEHRQKRMLKMVQVIFPDNNKITFVTIDANDKRAMAKIEQEVRSHYEVEDSDLVDTRVNPPYPKEGQGREDQDARGDRGRAGDIRKAAPRHRQGPPR